jgi:hypothetical protein
VVGAPKGDPSGLIRQIDDITIAIADRPGNRRTDALHNLMDDPRIALLGMQPGSHDVTEIRGTARVCTDGALLESMRLRYRTPKVALVIDVEHRELATSPPCPTPTSGTRVGASMTARYLGPPRSGPTMFGATPTPAPEPRSLDGSSPGRHSRPVSPTTTGPTSECPTSPAGWNSSLRPQARRPFHYPRQPAVHYAYVVISTTSGADGTRTHDPLLAKQVL